MSLLLSFGLTVLFARVTPAWIVNLILWLGIIGPGLLYTRCPSDHCQAFVLHFSYHFPWKLISVAGTLALKCFKGGTSSHWGKGDFWPSRVVWHQFVSQCVVSLMCPCKMTCPISEGDLSPLNRDLNWQFLTFILFPPSPPTDNIGAMVIVWRVRGEIIWPALCCCAS